MSSLCFPVSIPLLPRQWYCLEVLLPGSKEYKHRIFLVLFSRSRWRAKKAYERQHSIHTFSRGECHLTQSKVLALANTRIPHDQLLWSHTSFHWSPYFVIYMLLEGVCHAVRDHFLEINRNLQLCICNCGIMGIPISDHKKRSHCWSVRWLREN